MNDLFYSDERYLLGKTNDRAKIRNIKRTNKGKTWRHIGYEWEPGVKKYEEYATFLYHIPIKQRRSAERFFGVEARRLDGT